MHTNVVTPCCRNNCEHAMNQLPGIIVAVVVDNVDPANLGRIRLRFALGTQPKPVVETWARLALPMAAADLGIWRIPDIGAEVVVAFEAGNPQHPIAIGTLWNPASPAASDAPGAPALSITTSGQLTVHAHEVLVNADRLTVNAAVSQFSGLVQADSILTNSVVSASYSPGAGNIS